MPKYFIKVNVSVESWVSREYANKCLNSVAGCQNVSFEVSMTVICIMYVYEIRSLFCLF